MSHSVRQQPQRARTPAPAPGDRLARWVSILGHPFIVIPASVGALSALEDADERPALAIGAAFLALAAGVFVGVRAGHFNDFDVSERRRRPTFYVLATGVALLIGACHRDNPATLRACWVAAAMLAACAVLNRWTKVSLHTAFAVYAAALWGAWSVGAGLAGFAIAAWVGWSRAHLGRHSRGEVVAGALIGLIGGACLASADTGARSEPAQGARSMARAPVPAAGEVCSTSSPARGYRAYAFRTAPRSPRA